MEFLGLTTSQWADLGLSALIVVGAAVMGRLLIVFLFDGGARWLSKRTRTSLDDVVLTTARSPVYWMIVVLALRIAIHRLDFGPQVGENWPGTAFSILYLVIGFIFAWRLISNLFIWYGKEIAQHTETELDEQLMPFFRRVALIILSVVALTTLLGQLQVDVSAFVTTLGIGSLAIALAAQATLSDMISGFVIMIDRPFRIGDRIEIQELATWGDVVDIGLRSCRIRMRDNRMVIVPNSVIGKSLVVNYSYPDTQYRIQIHIGVAYETDIELARQTMVEAVRGVEGVLPHRKVEALFLEFGEPAMIFRVRWWIESYVDTRRMFDRVNTALSKALDEVGIVMPDPQYQVFHKIAPDDEERIASVLRG